MICILYLFNMNMNMIFLFNTIKWHLKQGILSYSPWKAKLYTFAVQKFSFISLE